jgi:hypothetical protein
VDRLSRLGASVALLAAAILLTPASAAPAYAQAAEAPATLVYTMGCPTGAFHDIGRDECWSCPATHPSRTIFPVNTANACERPAREEFRNASGPQAPTGILGTDCRPGWFLDIGLGKCYSCPSGFNRSTLPVTHARACSRVVGAAASPATFVRAAGCPAGSFQHLLSGKCYTCPQDMERNARLGDDPATFNACAYSDAARARRLSLAKVEELALQLSKPALASLKLSENRNTASRLKSRDASLPAEAQAEAQREVGANPCVLDAFNTWTLGAAADANAVVGVSGESGMAVDIRKAARDGAVQQRPAYWYAGGSYNIGLQAGGSGGLAYGCWVDENNAIGGDSHGFVFDVIGIAQTAVGANTGKLADAIKNGFSKGGASLGLGVWFSNDWRFQGITLTPGFGRGFGLGTYSRAGTFVPAAQ